MQLAEPGAVVLYVFICLYVAGLSSFCSAAIFTPLAPLLPPPQYHTLHVVCDPSTR